MSAALVIALIQLAMKMPQLVSEIRALLAREGISPDEINATQALLERDPLSYFAPNTQAVSTPFAHQPAPTQAFTQRPGDVYETWLPVVPPESQLKKGDEIFSVNRGGFLYYWIRPAGSSAMAPPDANVVRAVPETYGGNNNAEAEDKPGTENAEAGEAQHEPEQARKDEGT